MVQCVAVCCGALQVIAVCCRVFMGNAPWAQNGEKECVCMCVCVCACHVNFDEPLHVALYCNVV